MLEITQADRELFITLSNADGQMAERILCGQAFTWEVEQIARHRLAEREINLRGELLRLQRKNAALNAENERLRGYADHTPYCQSRIKGLHENPCTCGLTALIKEIEGE